MAAEVGRAWVAILPSAKGFSGSLHKQVVPASESAGKESGARFGSFFTKASVGPLRAFGEAAAGIFAVEKVGEFFKSAIEEARQSQKVSALTGSVIKSTGGAAGVSAKQVGDLANAISKKVGVDDEAIQSGENLLLTFTNIRNEAGAGNDVFNRATRTITDMSAALGQDLKSSAIQVGKALNDPIKGVTALQRVGVSFDAQQKKQIATLVNSGKTLKAQKLILHELGREFGGAAAASATAGEKLKVAFDNVKESIGTALLPVLDRAESALVGQVLPALSQGASAAGRFFSALRANRTIQATVSAIGDGFTAILGAVKNAAVALGPFAKDLAVVAGSAVVVGVRALAGVFDGLAKAAEAVTGFFAQNKTATAALAGAVVGLLLPALTATIAEFGTMIALNVGAALYIVAGSVGAAATAFYAADGAVASFGAALEALNINPVILAITAVAAASAVMIHAFNGQMHAAQDAGRAMADNYIKTLDLSNTSVKTISANITGLGQQLVKTADAGGGIGQLSGHLDELGKTLSAQLAAQKSAIGNQTQLSRAYGLSTHAVARLASANGIDLSGSYDTVAGKIAAVIGPTKTLTIDTKVMGTAAAGSANQVNALADAVTKLLGNFLGVKQAELSFRTDLTALDAALKKSHGSLNANTKAGAAARAQYLTTAGAIGDVANAMAKNGASTDQVRHKIRDMLGAFADTPAGGKLVANTLDHIRHLADTLDLKGAGSKSTGTFADGVGSAKGRATSAAKSVLGSVKSAFGKPGDVSSEGVSLVQGFAAGMQSNNALVSVASAAAVVITSAINALHHHGKGGSPYKRFIPEGRWAAQGFAIGMGRAQPAISRAAKNLVGFSLSAIREAGNRIGRVAQGLANGLDKAVQKITGNLSVLPKQAQTWWTAIGKAGAREVAGLTSRLDHLSSQFQKTTAAAKQMTQDIKASLTQNTGLANIDMSTVTSPGGLVAGFDTQLRDLKTFVHDLHLLRKKGLSKSLYNQLLAMGPTAGLPIAADLLADPSTIAQLNRDQARVDQLSSSFAQNASQAKYGKTLDHQLSELRGLRQDMREERRVLGTLGRQVVNAEHKIAREKRQKERTKTGGSTTASGSTKTAGP